MLRAVGAALRVTAREVDLLYRWGGDEFVVMLRQTDKAGAQMVAKRYAAAIEEIPLTKRVLYASTGIATYPLDAGSEEQLLHVADVWLYGEKARRGKHGQFPP